MSEHLLPDNATGWEKSVSQSTARIELVPNPIRTLWSPYTCPVAVLPWLANDLSVDEWDSSWTEQQKRDTIAASIEVHRRKGTVGAVKRAIEALGHEVEIDEDTGEAYTFRLLLDTEGRALEEAHYRQVEAVTERTKNIRSHLANTLSVLKKDGPVYCGGVAVSGEVTEVLPKWQGEFNGSGQVRLTAAYAVQMRVAV